MKLSVILPCYNEQENIPRFEKELIGVLKQLPLESFEILAVDDGSRDQTLQALRQWAAKEGRVRVLTHEKNQGLGRSVRTGLEAAAYEWAVVLDADLTFAPSQIKDLIEAQKKIGADCVLGSPFLGRFEGVPFFRLIPSTLINKFYWMLFGRQLTAFTPIFRLYRVSALRDLPLQSDGFEINAEIVALLLRRGYKLAEVPVTLGVRREGKSKLSAFRELKNHFKLCVRLFLK